MKSGSGIQEKGEKSEGTEKNVYTFYCNMQNNVN